MKVDKNKSWLKRSAFKHARQVISMSMLLTFAHLAFWAFSFLVLVMIILRLAVWLVQRADAASHKLFIEYTRNILAGVVGGLVIYLAEKTETRWLDTNVTIPVILLIVLVFAAGAFVYSKFLRSQDVESSPRVRRRRRATLK